jgi:predicted ABC-type transport system involved in lysophospholipase L1 biosynthesis ATPase subunit
VLDALLALNRTEGATLVLVTHDAELTRHAGRTIAMRDGRIVS